MNILPKTERGVLLFLAGLVILIGLSMYTADLLNTKTVGIKEGSKYTISVYCSNNKKYTYYTNEYWIYDGGIAIKVDDKEIIFQNHEVIIQEN